VLIDWFTVIAQIINFLILVALLRYFLYDPIIQAMDAREGRIAADLEAAERKREEAAQEIKTYQEKNQELDAQRDDWLREAKEEVEERRKEMIHKARREMDETRDRWYQALQQEKDAFLEDLRQRTGRQVYAILRQALTDLAGAELEERLVDVFLQRLEDLDSEERQAIAAALGEEDQEVVIYSAHELPSETRKRLTTAVQTLRADDSQNNIRFADNPDLIGGLELRVTGYKVAWSLSNYLASLEEELAPVIHA
jgi:F-type H+-transporting ATPase subunit b